MQSENETLCLKATDLEARSWWQNIKIIGLPEKIKNGHPTEFLAKFIPELLGTEATMEVALLIHKTVPFRHVSTVTQMAGLFW